MQKSKAGASAASAFMDAGRKSCSSGVDQTQSAIATLKEGEDSYSDADNFKHTKALREDVLNSLDDETLLSEFMDRAKARGLYDQLTASCFQSDELLKMLPELIGKMSSTKRAEILAAAMKPVTVDPSLIGRVLTDTGMILADAATHKLEDDAAKAVAVTAVAAVKVEAATVPAAAKAVATAAAVDRAAVATAALELPAANARAATSPADAPKAAATRDAKAASNPATTAARRATSPKAATRGAPVATSRPKAPTTATSRSTGISIEQPWPPSGRLKRLVRRVPVPPGREHPPDEPLPWAQLQRSRARLLDSHFPFSHDRMARRQRAPPKPESST